ncbi:MAG: phosphoribosylformylglycinamidine synthase subunit PurL [Rhodospirillales bacterium]|nr:phosphoribosylformylglycinamidine synthase subunit PurL [Rhodospirillales bacterium]MCB9996640.1 phosphoribosylformylglycinamidine synthase subunit PurL [Rhodospirillales bacterium]
MTNTAAKITEPVFNEPEITPALAAEHGINTEEYQLMLDICGRMPSFTELGIFSVMWSEHCSYKSSRLHLKKLPTDAPWVIQGPGENAGVIDIGDGQAAVFKMESHNHPSFIEPYQGAATGVGGIMRDVFTMGARPIANLNALRFGDPSHPKTRHLISGVVAGIGGYGNCMGVPTVGGEVNFHESYNGNILVNAMTVGIAQQDSIYYARGAGVDQPVVYVGSKTGRDGIHGATMASAVFDDEAEDTIATGRPTVQVGDPFTEKLLLEACLELMQEDAIISIQDMGAAGLTSSSVEIADKGGIGVELDLDKVPQREPNMSPYEIMLSESQERMLMTLKPGKEQLAEAIFKKWDLDFAVIGRTTDDKRLRLNMYGKTWCDIPVPPLVDEAPVYDRPRGDYPKAAPLNDADYPLPESNPLTALKTLIGCPDLASKRWIWEQYDHLVMGETVAAPGQADAALVKLPDSDKALAMTSDCTPRYCQANPFEGGKQVIAESYRNICATGAKPLAVTDNLNFANPERPDIMAQFVGCIEGMAEACNTLEYPVISGNVSLYNETNGQPILPTPTIGGVGLIDDWHKAMSIGFKAEGEMILLLGAPGAHLGQSLYLREVHGAETGDAPSVDLSIEGRTGVLVRTLIEHGLLTACHDISDGGLLCALADMALAGLCGAALEIDPENPAGFWFGEDQARYVLTTKDADAVREQAAQANIPVSVLGQTGGTTLQLADGQAISIEALRQISEDWLPAYMEGKS